MTIDRESLPEIPSELLMAYADGELDPIRAKQVERAIANDASLATQVDQHRRLRAVLAGHFQPIAAAPLPGRLQGMLESATVIDLAAARATRIAPSAAGRWRHWGTGGALAASLILGLMIGRGIDQGPVSSRDGALVASGTLAQTLDTQLAATQPIDAPVRILVSFQDQSGQLCRSFSGAALSGIACQDGKDWLLRQTRAGTVAQRSQFRQAGSADAVLLADAQAMMMGDPLDAEAEIKARENGWRR